MTHERAGMTLDEIGKEIFIQMEAQGYADGTINIYKGIFKRLEKLAESTGVTAFDPDLAQQFIEDSAYHCGGGYCRSRYLYHVRIVQFVDSYISSGEVDWSIMKPAPTKNLVSSQFRALMDDFNEHMKSDGLKPNTVDGYARFVYYFLSFLEDKGYNSLSDIQKGDITLFLVLACQEHYAPTSLGAHVSGLRRFIEMVPELKPYGMEIPEHMPKKVGIIPSYTEEEHEKVDRFLADGDLSARDRAIALIAFGTGLRAIDICGLKLVDVDWEHDVIQIRQAKTGRPLSIPIRPSLGNALAAYLLEERPKSDSPYVFLRALAPYAPLADHASIYSVLRKILSESGVQPDGRISGTRMTRHSYASRLLRKGTPLTVIADALGHNSPDSTMRYLSTDEAVMSGLTLPLPEGGAS